MRRVKQQIALLLIIAAPLSITQAQDNKATQASARERAGAVVFGLHCSSCHGVRLMKEDAAFDLVTYIKGVDEERFVRAAKTARGSMPSFGNTLTDQDIKDVYAYVKRGHSPDLNDVRMESNH